MSTLTLGTFFITSTAVPPMLDKFFSTLNILRSIPIVSKGLSAVTVTPSSCCASVCILKLPRSLSTALNMLLMSPPDFAAAIFKTKAAFCSIDL